MLMLALLSCQGASTRMGAALGPFWLWQGPTSCTKPPRAMFGWGPSACPAVLPAQAGLMSCADGKGDWARSQSSGQIAILDPGWYH